MITNSEPCVLPVACKGNCLKSLSLGTQRHDLWLQLKVDRTVQKETVKHEFPLIWAYYKKGMLIPWGSFNTWTERENSQGSQLELWSLIFVAIIFNTLSFVLRIQISCTGVILISSGSKIYDSLITAQLEVKFELKIGLNFM